MTASQDRKVQFEKIVQVYGDLVYDYSLSFLMDVETAKSTTLEIFKKLYHQLQVECFRVYERAWVMHWSSQVIRKTVEYSSEQRLKLEERMQLDAIEVPGQRLQKIELFSKNLAFEDRAILFLRDKYGLPYGEIGKILGLPEETVKLRRLAGLGYLESWAWERG